MKNIFLLMFIAILCGCGGLKKQIAEKDIGIKQQEQKNEKLRQKIDSLVAYYQSEVSRISSEKQKTNWIYTAPKVVEKTDTVTVSEKIPVFLEVNGKMVNVADLPAGSSLSSSTELERSEHYYEKIVSQLEQKITDLQKELSQKAKVVYRDREKQVEIERQTVQWLLVAGALALGIFIPDFVRWIWKKVKSSQWYFKIFEALNKKR